MVNQHRIRGLDELRGIAILAVVLGHWAMSALPWSIEMRPRWCLIAAISAVDLFFVISGFLITVILLRSEGGAGSARTFYLRRARRILPLALMVIAYSYWRYPASRGHVWPYLLFWNNYSLTWSKGQAMMGLGPMWSLAIEEQFYVVWPFVVWMVPRRWLWATVAVLCSSLIVLPIAQLSPVSIVDGLYLSDGRTHYRALGIALGAGLALWRADLVPRPLVVVAGLLLTYGAAAALWGRVAGLATIPVLIVFTTLVGLAVSGQWVLRCRPLAWVGVRCYGLYLLHPLVLLEIGSTLPWLGIFGHLALYLALCLLLAAASFAWFETPIIRWAGRRVPESAPAVVAVSSGQVS